MGFVFGIPRTPKESGAGSSQPPNSGQPGDSPAKGAPRKNNAVESNSNLVEISDWLTKIIVGVGLVQMNKIPGEVRQLSAYIGNGLRDCDSKTCEQSSEAVAFVIMLFFFCTGFLIGYLWARLYLQKALSDLSIADQVDQSWDNVAQADQAIDDDNLDRANALLDMALRLDPSNPKAHKLKGYVLKRLAQRSGKPGDPALLQQALDHELEAAKVWTGDGGVFFNIACYQALLGKDKTLILANLTRAFGLDPALKQAAAGEREEDLRSLWNDADFKKLTA